MLLMQDLYNITGRSFFQIQRDGGVIFQFIHWCIPNVRRAALIYDIGKRDIQIAVDRILLSRRSKSFLLRSRYLNILYVKPCVSHRQGIFRAAQRDLTAFYGLAIIRIDLIFDSLYGSTKMEVCFRNGECKYGHILRRAESLPCYIIHAVKGSHLVAVFRCHLHSNNGSRGKYHLSDPGVIINTIGQILCRFVLFPHLRLVRDGILVKRRTILKIIRVDHIDQRQLGMRNIHIRTLIRTAPEEVTDIALLCRDRAQIQYDIQIANAFPINIGRHIRNGKFD